MSLREKINLLAPGEFSGRACLSALSGAWRRISSGDPTPSSQNQILLARLYDQQTSSPELQGLIATLKTIRQRIVANTLLRNGTKWFVWMLIGLVAVGAISTKLTGALLFVAVLAAVGAIAILVWTWRNRPSNYETARRLDSAAGLKDRASTTIYFGGAENADGMIAEQRKDALARLAKVDARGFFPVQLPGNFRRASVLVLVVAGLFAYRIHHQPPLVSLLQSTAHSQLVQSILNPIVHAMEKDLQRTIALVTMKPDQTGEETQRSDAASNSDDLWKADNEKGPGPDDKKDSADAGDSDQQQDQLQAPGEQEGNPSGDARQSSNSQSQDGKSGNEGADSKSQQESEQQGPEGRQSLGQSLMQALKNMMSNSPNQQSSNRANQQPPNGQGTPQSGNSHQPGDTESDKRGDSRGSSDAKQKATQTASEGAGSQQGTKELTKNQEMHPVNAVPDRVALEASGFKEQTRMKLPTETGTAQLTDRGLSPQQDAVTNGAEQENIPARYRFYVQRYFEHADNGKH